MNENVRIALVEDQADYLRALTNTLQAEPGWRVVARCLTAAQALREVPSTRPDLILLDLRLPEVSGIDLIPKLKARLPRTPVIALTVEDQPAEIVRAIQAGASGYLLKQDGPDLVAGIQDVLAGGAAVMSPAVARRLWDAAQTLSQAPRKAPQLSPREWEILQLAARGRQQGEIAALLGIALNTVKNHTRNIYEKLGVGTLIEAVIQVRGGKGLLD